MLVVGVPVRNKARRVSAKNGGVHWRESGLGVFLFAFRVSFSVQSGASLKTSTRRFQSWPSGTSQLLLRSQGPRGPMIVFVRCWGWVARGLKMAAEPLDETLSQV
jgi:hypothetical protein